MKISREVKKFSKQKLDFDFGPISVVLTQEQVFREKSRHAKFQADISKSEL